jgi:hypothetical protein
MVTKDHPNYHPNHCYFNYNSGVDTPSFKIPDEPVKEQQLQDSIIANLVDHEVQGQVSLTILNPPNIQLLVSRRGAICVSLGISDYTPLLATQQQLGNLSYQFQDKGKTYLTLVHRRVASQLKGIAQKICQAGGLAPPEKVYLRIQSKPNTPSEISNITPSQDQLVKYLDLSDVTADIQSDQFKAIQLETEVPISSHVPLDTLESQLQHSAEQHGLSVKVNMSPT